MKSKVSITLDSSSQATAQGRARRLSDEDLLSAVDQAKRDFKRARKEYRAMYAHVDQAWNDHGVGEEWALASREADAWWHRMLWAEDVHLAYNAEAIARRLY